MTPCGCKTTGHEPDCPNSVQGVYVGGVKVAPLVLHTPSPAPALMERLLQTSPPAWDQGARDMVRWMAQTTHQAYHNDDGPNGNGSWETCTKDICYSARKFLLGELTPTFARLVKEAQKPLLQPDSPCPHEARQGKHEVYLRSDGTSFCRACGAELVTNLIVPLEVKPKKRTCNRHDDCDAVDAKAKAKYDAATPREKINLPLRAEHCDDETCEDCHGY